jgi:hypothetical protein
LCSLLHKTPSELENESAVELDWLLEIDNTVAEFKSDMQKKAMRDAK